MSEQYSNDARRGQDPDTGRRSLRDQHGAVTRTTILRAAHRLFLDLGYTQTSVRALADAAGVAVQTIYSTFGSKLGVLMGLIQLFDDETVEPGASRMTQTDDAVEKLKLVARLERTARESGAPMLRMLREAGISDPEVLPVWESAWERHRSGVEQLCRWLAQARALRAGLTTETATATVLAVTSMEAYDEVVGHRGWTHDQYEDWLAETLRVALLPGSS